MHTAVVSPRDRSFRALPSRGPNKYQNTIETAGFLAWMNKDE